MSLTAIPSGCCVIKGERGKNNRQKINTKRNTQEDIQMMNTEAKTIITNSNGFTETVEKIRERKAARKSALRKVMNSLFSCRTENTHNLSPEMQARLYL